MPMPTPNEGESKEEWDDRCMSSDVMNEEYPDNDQRYAVCTRIWEEKQSESNADKEGKEVQRRCLSLERGAEVRLEEHEGEERIRGVAAVYYDGTPGTEFEIFDGLVERIMPGAFDDALANKADVMALFNHNPDHVLGRRSNETLALRSTTRGLEYEITPPETNLGRDVVTLLKRKDIQGSSFAFDMGEDSVNLCKHEDGVDISEIVKVTKLFDVGPVTYPAYKATQAMIAKRMREMRQVQGCGEQEEDAEQKERERFEANRKRSWRSLEESVLRKRS